MGHCMACGARGNIFCSDTTNYHWSRSFSAARKIIDDVERDPGGKIEKALKVSEVEDQALCLSGVLWSIVVALVGKVCFTRQIRRWVFISGRKRRR